MDDAAPTVKRGRGISLTNCNHLQIIKVKPARTRNQRKTQPVVVEVQEEEEDEEVMSDAEHGKYYVCNLYEFNKCLNNLIIPLFPL